MERVERISHRRKAYETIRNMIIEQEIKPGSPIWETELAKQLNMSRTPVREALQRLRSDGLLYHINKRGLFVIDLTGEEVEKSYQLAEALESMVAYLLAIKNDTACIQALEEKVSSMELSLDDNNSDKWVESDSQFHDIMLEYCDNKYIVEALKKTNIMIKNVRIRFTRLLFDRKKSTRYHRLLLNAIRNGDAKEARLIWQEHLSEISREIGKFLI